MANNDLASEVSKLLDRSRADVSGKLEALPAEDVINLKVATDDKDRDLAASILDQTSAPEKKITDPRAALKEINRLGKSNLKRQEPMDAVWELIGEMKPDDWRMGWPTVDEEILIALYNEIGDSETDSVSGEQSQEIYTYAREFVTEHMMYQGQLVEVVVPRGPQGTVGILLNGHLQMVTRKELSMLGEHVLGMTAMPSLGRIKQLAGIANPVVTKSAPPREEFVEMQNHNHQEVQIQLDTLLAQVEKIQHCVDHEDDLDAALIACGHAKRSLSRLIMAIEAAS